MACWRLGKKFRYTTVALAVSISTFALQVFAGQYAVIPAEPTRDHHSRIFEPNPIILAQSATDQSGERGRAAVETEETSPESPSPATEGGGTEQQEAQTGQVKPFKPSEEIAAEQAVDFPWDI